MYFPKTLDKLNKVKTDSLNLVDLKEQPVSIRTSSANLLSVDLVPKWAEMRIDTLVALRYGGVEKFGIILKYNEISNPFAVESGDYISFIDTFSINTLSKEISKLDILRTKIRDQFIDPTKTPIGSAAFNEFKNRNLLPPQYRKAGEKEITYKDGLQIFGNKQVKTTFDDLPPSEQNFYKKNKIPWKTKSGLLKK